MRAPSAIRDSDGRKRCPKCQEWKPEAAFNRASAAVDGLYWNCRECGRAADEKRRDGVPRRRDTSIRDEMGRKFCPGCAEWLSEERFHKARGKNPAGDGLKSYCKECAKEKSRASTARHGRSWVLKRYGLTIEDYDRMLLKQGDGCAICGSADSGVKWGAGHLHVDHCHKTNMVRGPLCQPCNVSLGKMRDSPDLLRIAADYLEEWVH